VCCSVLQCVAACCSVLQRVAELSCTVWVPASKSAVVNRCSVLQRVAVRATTLQQDTATTHCNNIVSVSESTSCAAEVCALQHVVAACIAVCCSVLPCVAVRCSVLQSVAVWSSVRVRVAVCCSVLKTCPAKSQCPQARAAV